MYPKSKIMLLICIFNIFSLKASLPNEEIISTGTLEVEELSANQDQHVPEQITIEQKLVTAIALNDVKEVKQIFIENPNLDVNFIIDNDDKRPVHLAVDKNVDILHSVLMHKANPDAITKADGYTPLHLIAIRPDIDYQIRRRNTKLLLQWNADPKIKCKKTCEHWASGARALARNNKNWPVENVLSNNSKSVERYKKRKGEDYKKAKRRKLGSTQVVPVSQPVSESSSDIAHQKLIDAINSNSLPELLQVFVDNPELNPNFLVDNNKRPIHIAIDKDPEIVKLLLQRNADPNARTLAEGYTPSHLLASIFSLNDDQKKIAQILLNDPRIDLYVKSNYRNGHQGLIAKTLARNTKNYFMVTLLTNRMLNDKRKQEKSVSTHSQNFARANRNNDLSAAPSVREQNSAADINIASAMLLGVALQSPANLEIAK